MADKLGIYLYVECGSWCSDLGSGHPIDSYLYDESERIVKEYGNHPSFCLMSYGNEPHGKSIRNISLSLFLIGRKRIPGSFIQLQQDGLL